jgi:hypothetical protein
MLKQFIYQYTHFCKHRTPELAVNPLQVEENMNNGDKFTKIQLPVLVRDGKGGSRFPNIYICNTQELSPPSCHHVCHPLHSSNTTRKPTFNSCRAHNVDG